MSDNKKENNEDKKESIDEIVEKLHSNFSGIGIGKEQIIKIFSTLSNDYKNLFVIDSIPEEKLDQISKRLDEHEKRFSELLSEMKKFQIKVSNEIKSGSEKLDNSIDAVTGATISSTACK